MKNLNVMRGAALAALITVGMTQGANAAAVGSNETLNTIVPIECGFEFEGDNFIECMGETTSNLTKEQELELENLYKQLDEMKEDIKDENKIDEIYKKIDKLTGYEGKDLIVEPEFKLPKNLEDMLGKIEKLEEEGKEKEADKLWNEFAVEEFKYLHKDNLEKVSNEKQKEVIKLYESIINEEDMQKFENTYNNIYKILGYKEQEGLTYASKDVVFGDGETDIIEIDFKEPKEAKEIMEKILKLEKEGKFEETDALWEAYDKEMFKYEIKDLSDAKKVEANKINDKINVLKSKNDFNNEDSEKLDDLFDKLYKLIDAK